MKAVPFGDDALLVYLDDPLAAAEAVADLGLDDVVPAEDCVLLRGPQSRLWAARKALRARTRRPAATGLVVLPVRYRGEDLHAVAEASGLSTEAVVRIHLEGVYEVAFCGFAPGFGYLRGLDERLHLPRRAEPRVSVAAGSVAIAAGYCAVYPRASPGGWHVLGHTSATLFDPDADPPTPLVPGTAVRFVRS